MMQQLKLSRSTADSIMLLLMQTARIIPLMSEKLLYFFALKTESESIPCAVLKG
jgi:hypothetical protein